MKGYDGALRYLIPLSLPCCGMERQAPVLCSLAQPCLTLLFPVLGLRWVAGHFLVALCPLSLSLALPSPCQSVNLPRALAPFESLGRPWAKRRAQGPGRSSQQ